MDSDEYANYTLPVRLPSISDLREGDQVMIMTSTHFVSGRVKTRLALAHEIGHVEASWANFIPDPAPDDRGGQKLAIWTDHGPVPIDGDARPVVRTSLV